MSQRLQNRLDIWSDPSFYFWKIEKCRNGQDFSDFNLDFTSFYIYLDFVWQFFLKYFRPRNAKIVLLFYFGECRWVKLQTRGLFVFFTRQKMGREQKGTKNLSLPTNPTKNLYHKKDKKFQKNE